jgi:leader peptidase (prepilin peptidase) / N-methyltransferase
LDTAVRAIFAVLLGLAMGSFVTVLVHRIPRKESIVAPRSRCPVCGAEIRPRDNIPVLSYVLLMGRCRGCGAKISPEYPLLELATAGLFAGAALRFDSTYTALMMALFFMVLLAVAVIDVSHKIVPNRIVYPSLVGFAVLVAIGSVVGDHFHLAGAGLGFLAYGGVLFLVAMVSPGGMGMGDVKLAALIGLVLGALGFRYVAVAAGVGILAGGIGALALLLFAHASRKKAIPFGPYLAAGAVVAAFLGPKIATWYTGLAR